jgi:type IV pilus assembly protein PilQ
VPWDKLLDIVLRTKGLDKRIQGNMIIVGPAEKLAAMDLAELARKRAQDAAAQSPTR